MRRLIDIVVAACGIAALFPLMLILALGVALAMGRPVLFTQMRVGKHGRAFWLVKFRTMTDARDASGQLLSDQERTTWLGRLLRRTRLDELPELWNVLTGDMSLIGPRPLLETSFATQGIPGRVRASVRPGLTGWAQVNGNTLLSDEEKLALDLWYTEHVSLLLDLKILMMTVGMLLGGERIDRRELRRARESNHRWRG